MLLVPADSERKMAKGAETGADALILDLEDAVAPTPTHITRDMAVDDLKARSDRSTQQLWLRINPLDTEGSRGALRASAAPMHGGRDAEPQCRTAP